jgi:hypothetical protein
MRFQFNGCEIPVRSRRAVQYAVKAHAKLPVSALSTVTQFYGQPQGAEERDVQLWDDVVLERSSHCVVGPAPSDR